MSHTFGEIADGTLVVLVPGVPVSHDVQRFLVTIVDGGILRLEDIEN